MSNALVLQVNLPGKQVKNPSMMAYTPDIYSVSNRDVKKYADRIGADYVCIRDDRHYPGTHPVWQKCAVFSPEYSQYETIIFADSDYMFHDASPNLLDITNIPDKNFYIALEITEKLTPKWDKSTEHWNINSGLFVIKKPLRDRLQTVWKWYWDEYTQGRRRKTIGGEQDAIRDMMHDHFLNETQFLNKHWNGGKAIKRPLFGLHYCAMRKMEFTIDAYNRAVQNKRERLSQMSQEEIESLYYES